MNRRLFGLLPLGGFSFAAQTPPPKKDCFETALVVAMVALDEFSKVVAEAEKKFGKSKALDHVKEWLSGEEKDTIVKRALSENNQLSAKLHGR